MGAMFIFKVYGTIHDGHLSISIYLFWCFKGGLGRAEQLNTDLCTVFSIPPFNSIKIANYLFVY